MLTITNYSPKTPQFKARVKMGTSGKIGTYLKNKGINPNALLFSGAVGSGGLAFLGMVKPDLYTQPEFMKYGLFAGMASGLGMMAGNTIADNEAKVRAEEEEKKLLDEEQKANPERKNVIRDKKYGAMALTDKGLEQYLSLSATTAQAESLIIAYTQRGEASHPKVGSAYKYSETCMETLAQLGELPDLIPNASATQLQLEMPR